MVYVTIYNSLKERLFKKKEVESEIDETLRIKYDILNKLKILLNKGLKGKDANSLDTLTKMEKITDEKLTSFELYRSLIDFENKMLRLKDNAKKMTNVEEFENEFEKIEDINVRLSGEIKYYNDVISSYMKIYSKFPGIIIAKTARLKDERYFDNRNLDDSVEKDFQI
jgi:hypothetical protein